AARARRPGGPDAAPRSGLLLRGAGGRPAGAARPGAGRAPLVLDPPHADRGARRARPALRGRGDDPGRLRAAGDRRGPADRAPPVAAGPAAFRAYPAALRTVDAPGHWLYLGGWFLDDSFPLVPGDPASTFGALTTEIARRGADVRALLWDAALRQNSEPIE